MRWQRAITFGTLLLALVALAAWQWDEYGHECDLARETVSSSADSVMNALVGGMRSHRRLGQFFAENIQGVLDGLTQAKDVRAVAVVPEDPKAAISAGDVTLLDLAAPLVVGGRWDPKGYQLVATLKLPAASAGPGGGRGGGGGRGMGRRWQQEEEATPSAFGPGKTVAVALLVARDRADAACDRSARLRSLIAAAGWVVVLCVAWAWRASVRLAEARGRGRSLEIEARHFRELSQAAAGLAHETRNPLGLIRGWTQRLAESDAESGDARRQARAVIEECDRVTARINQFLAFARPSQPQPQRFDSGEVVEELAVLLEPDVAAKHVTIQALPRGTMVTADREMLRQALFNLLQNAVQASPERASLETSVSHGRDGRRRIEVADRGPGVAADAVDKLFTPYFTTRPGGTGLGLAIVRRIAAAHGWEVGYTPRPGGGAIFWLDGIHG